MRDSYRDEPPRALPDPRGSRCARGVPDHGHRDRTVRRQIRHGRLDPCPVRGSLRNVSHREHAPGTAGNSAQVIATTIVGSASASLAYEAAPSATSSSMPITASTSTPPTPAGGGPATRSCRVPRLAGRKLPAVRRALRRMRSRARSRRSRPPRSQCRDFAVLRSTRRHHLACASEQGGAIHARWRPAGYFFLLSRDVT